MEPWNFDKTSPGRLSQLLRPDEGTPEWSTKDLEAILRHQLSAPLATDLGSELLSLDGRLSQLSGPDRFEGLLRMTFAELLLHPRPPEEALRLVKSFAKERRSDSTPLLSVEVVTALYYAALAAAELRLPRSISTLDADAMRSGVDWAISKEWIVEPLRRLFVEARARL